jgi:quinoprotein glucose dehydrogenase
MYVLSFDAPSIYKMSTEAPGANRAPARAAAGSGPGAQLYAQNCSACHGANREGQAGAIPSLQGVVQRLGAQTVMETVAGGRGQMPAFGGSLSESQLQEIVSYLANPEAPASGEQQFMRRLRAMEDSSVPFQGPVVGNGGAPIPADVKANSPSTPFGYSGGMAGPPYPENTKAANLQRWYTGYNIIRYITSPPWSTLTAYDMNNGTIKWQVPLGEDPRAVKEGAHNTGTMLEPKGAIVTSTGLVFHAARDGKIRAYDADTGKVLWTADLPAGSAAIPAMYEVNGRAYLLVSATAATPQVGISGIGIYYTGGGVGESNVHYDKAYVAFALPATPKAGVSSTARK